ncbi:Topless-related protein 3 [Raphanus sativus]|nr:Topless-related protein 3 [Raphanus sativus]
MGEEKIRSNANASRKSRQWRHARTVSCGSDPLRLRCRISPSAYFPQGNQGLSPLVVAAHPQEPNQFAVGLNDGSVKVIEPTEAEGKWGMVPPSEAINTSPSTTNNETQEQLQR